MFNQILNEIKFGIMKFLFYFFFGQKSWYFEIFMSQSTQAKVLCSNFLSNFLISCYKIFYKMSNQKEIDKGPSMNNVFFEEEVWVSKMEIWDNFRLQLGATGGGTGV